MIQRQLSNGTWIDEDSPGRFLDMVLERESWYAPRVNREPMTTRSEVLDYLATGQSIHYDDDWYANIRDGDVFQQRLEAKRRQKLSDPNYYHDGRKLDCGHVVYHSSHVMSASRGTSCTDCYDRMSN